jgi:two-component system chemotaxis sensor kinase CheA
LQSEFNLEKSGQPIEKIIYINKNENRFAIITDHIVGEYQAVIKPLQNTFLKNEFLCGASIMGDGNLALMLDTSKLLSSAFHSKI